MDFGMLHHHDQQDNDHKPDQVEVEIQQRHAQQRPGPVEHLQKWIVERQRRNDK
jgi:hypothetical protein